jgi:hypothetical protein
MPTFQPSPTYTGLRGRESHKPSSLPRRSCLRAGRYPAVTVNKGALLQNPKFSSPRSWPNTNAAGAPSYA